MFCHILLNTQFYAFVFKLSLVFFLGQGSAFLLRYGTLKTQDCTSTVALLVHSSRKIMKFRATSFSHEFVRLISNIKRSVIVFGKSLQNNELQEKKNILKEKIITYARSTLQNKQYHGKCVDSNSAKCMCHFTFLTQQ